jgi:phage terminase large subunit GpA-like protein
MVISEAMSSEGRSDIDIILPNNQFAVVEIKYIPAEVTEDNEGTKNTKKSPLTADLLQIMEKKAIEALNQLADTLQAEKYQNKGRVISAGVVVYGRDRVLVKFAD